jgi:N-methylhydantoinase A
MRYFGQLRDISIALPEVGRGEPFTEDIIKELIKTFHDRHQALYGWADPALPSVIAILKLRATARRRPFEIIKHPLVAADPSEALKRKRQVYFKELGGFVETACYEGDRLRPGNVISGPAVIEEQRTTVVVPPEAEVTVDAYNNYLAALP